jgi:hypothetical protein
VLFVHGPRGHVRLELEAGAFDSQAELAAWLSAADTAARLLPAAGEGALLALVRVGTATDDGAFHLVSGGTSRVAAAATAVVTRCVWFDALGASAANGVAGSAEGNGLRQSSYELELASDDPLARAASSAVLLRPCDDSAAAHDLAARAGLALAIALADARATELGRHLVALDGEYSVRLVGEGGAPGVPAEQLAWWHRDVRARLRVLALGGGTADMALDPPR